MGGDEYERREWRLKRLAADFPDRHRPPEHAASRCRAEANHGLSLDHRQLEGKPRTTSQNFTGARFGMNAPFSSWRPFEMFDRIRQVHTIGPQADRSQCVLKHLTGWANEWLAGAVLLIARLLSDEHNRGGRGPVAKHCLCSGLPQVAGSALRRGRPSIV